MASNGVVNLSNRPLNEEEISLLMRGLKFCPTPPCPDPGQSREDLDALHRRMRLMAFFEENPLDALKNSRPNQSLVVKQATTPRPNNLPFKDSKFKNKSLWRGPIGPANLEAFIASNHVDYNNRPVYKAPDKKNLTRAEEKCIKGLKNDKNIVIKNADKGSSVVIMNRSDYLIEGYKQLSDPLFYRHVDEDLSKQHMNEIALRVESMYQDCEIDETVKVYLTGKTFKTARFYLLPKIHKKTIPPPGRPVVAGIGSPTERISQFVDHFLNPISMKVRSYVRDTNDFLHKIHSVGKLLEGTILVTMDVTSLYTNIPNDEGLKASLLALQKHRTGDVKPRNLSIIKLLEMVLKKNNFQFNGNNYLQVGGTAIGTKAAPSFAIIYMGSFEDEYVYTYHLQPTLYIRYIDDIFMLWQHGADELEIFHQYLNTRVPTIKFTKEFSSEEVSFLDLKVRNIGNVLETDLYSKPTDSHDYLLYSSAHPQRCKDSIPYSQFLRIRRLCSRMIDFEKNVIDLSLHFLRREYPEDLILDAAILARQLDRTTLLKPTEDQTDNNKENIFLITTFHPSDHTVREIVHKNWEILGQSAHTEYIYKKKLVVGYKRPKNLRDILVNAGIPRQAGDEILDPNYVPPVLQVTSLTNLLTVSIPKATIQMSITDYFFTKEALINPSGSESDTSLSSGITPRPNIGRMGTAPNKRGSNHCGLKHCRYCPKLNKSGQIKSTTTGKTHNCMKNISCRSSNLIYCITCTKCGIQYVGQTLLRIKDRFKAHFYTTEKPDLRQVVARHFSHASHNGIFDMQISALEFIKKAPRSPASSIIRDRVERRWMHLLRTCAPKGLNIED